ncbi:MAG: S-layer homology domain-containing protein [Actinobacteria bacterium]|nr:S-layer homology domain-containing protein [Actinomycetota bacterium]
MKKSIFFVALLLVAVLVLAASSGMASTPKPSISVDLDALTIDGVGFELSTTGTVEQFSGTQATKETYDFEVDTDTTFYLELVGLEENDTLSIRTGGKQIISMNIPRLTAKADYAALGHGGLRDKNIYPALKITGFGPPQAQLIVTIEEEDIVKYQEKIKTEANGAYAFLVPKSWSIGKTATGKVAYAHSSGGTITKTFSIPRFRDIPTGYWAFKEIEALAEWGAISGHTTAPNTRIFQPNLPINRSQLAKILLIALDETTSVTHEKAFSDIPATHGSWPHVEAANKLGFIHGYRVGSKKEFRPEKAVSRAELAAILVRAAGLLDEAEQSMNTKTAFKDDSSIPKWARGYIVIAAKHGIIKGSQDNTFNAAKSTSRAEAAVAVARLVLQDDR